MSCPICGDEMAMPHIYGECFGHANHTHSNVVVLPCKHAFHCSCLVLEIEQQIKKYATKLQMPARTCVQYCACPYCRTPIGDDMWGALVCGTPSDVKIHSEYKPAQEFDNSMCCALTAKNTQCKKNISHDTQECNPKSIFEMSVKNVYVPGTVIGPVIDYQTLHAHHLCKYHQKSASVRLVHPHTEHVLCLMRDLPTQTNSLSKI